MSSDSKGVTELPGISVTDSEEFDVEGLEEKLLEGYEEEELDREEDDGLGKVGGVKNQEDLKAKATEEKTTMGQELTLDKIKLSDIEEEEEEGDFDEEMYFESLGYPKKDFLPTDINEIDDEEGEAAFMARYNDEFGGEMDLDDVNIPPKEQISVKSLEDMIRMLDIHEDNVPEEYEDEDDVYDNDSGFFKRRPDQILPIVLEEIPKSPEDENIIVLGPDHPKMKRFQAALKRHLKKQIYHEDCERRELEIDLKVKRKDREEIGTQLYNLQYELARQTEITEKYEHELEKLAVKRIEIDGTAEEAKKVNSKLQSELEDEVEEEKKIMKSVKEMDLIEWCIREAVKEYESQLKISQRVDERFQKLKTKAELDKKDQDIYLDRIIIRLQQMEESNENISRQIQAHDEEQKELNSFITEATTEIEALQIEKSQLQRAWNETINVVRSRDEALTAARKTLITIQEVLRTRQLEVNQLTKAIKKEQENHEMSTVRFKRRKMEERQLKSRVGIIEGQVEEVQGKLAILLKVRDQIQLEYSNGENELQALDKILEGPRQRIQKLIAEKKELEDEILKIIQEQTAMDKVAQGIARQIREEREKTRTVEDEITKIENDMSQVTLECEVLRTDLLKKQTLVSELEKKLSVQEKLLETQALEMKFSERVIQKKNQEIQTLSNKLAKLVEEQETLGINKLEEEAMELEKQLTLNRAICVELQEKWLKLQDELVGLTMKRDQILIENDLRRKEEFILDRKRQRLKLENETKEEEIRKLQRSIKQAQMEIQLLNSKLFEGKETHENMEKGNILLQNDLINVLKDAEMQAIELQDEVGRLESEKERLNKELGEANEQSLLWEKKVKMAKELKESIKKEQETSTTQLKLAIHHMQVRHNELRRVQEKLMSDLERCIDKRERIIQTADFNIKKNHIHPDKILLNIEREESNVNAKHRKLIKDAHDAEVEVKHCEGKIIQLHNKIKCESETLRSIKTIVDTADEKLSEASIEKHKNLIEIILRQIKYKTLESINLKRFQVHLDPKQLEEDIRKLEEKCYSVVELCDALLEEYPEFELPIKLVKASILPNVE